MSPSTVAVVLLLCLTLVFEREVGDQAGTSHLSVGGPLRLITASADVSKISPACHTLF